MKLFAIGAFALASLTASAAMAQSQAPANPGPVLPGVCSVSGEQILLGSAAGQALQARMVQLAQEAQGELAPYAQQIQTEYQALQQGASTIPADQLNQRRQQLEQRAREAQQLEQTRDAELRYTQGVQARAIEEAARPLILAVYQERGCGVLLRGESVAFINPAMDITGTVLQRLNTALPTLSFNRMTVPAQPQS
ncbi:OmpH family outer membrane protein [Brevundimonas sp.]|uniref:OmpH family outer membrane protein n=1 Tax=Brevundimonas sp. TaxID=1871086 RepID=UPI003D6D2E04